MDWRKNTSTPSETAKDGTPGYDERRGAREIRIQGLLEGAVIDSIAFDEHYKVNIVQNITAFTYIGHVTDRHSILHDGQVYTLAVL